MEGFGYAALFVLGGTLIIGAVFLGSWCLLILGAPKLCSVFLKTNSKKFRPVFLVISTPAAALCSLQIIILHDFNQSLQETGQAGFDLTIPIVVIVSVAIFSTWVATFIHLNKKVPENK